jgi:hypothetical protein
MRSYWTPSIIPNDNDQTVYLVADDFGRLGRAWREADYEATDLETVIQDLLTGQYSNPVRVVAFNTVERSPRCHSAWQPNPGRGSTYRRRKLCSDDRDQLSRSQYGNVRDWLD